MNSNNCKVKNNILGIQTIVIPKNKADYIWVDRSKLTSNLTSIENNDYRGQVKFDQSTIRWNKFYIENGKVIMLNHWTYDTLELEIQGKLQISNLVPKYIPGSTAKRIVQMCVKNKHLNEEAAVKLYDTYENIYSYQKGKSCKLLVKDLYSQWESNQDQVLLQLDLCDMFNQITITKELKEWFQSRDIDVAHVAIQDRKLFGDNRWHLTAGLKSSGLIANKTLSLIMKDFKYKWFGYGDDINILCDKADVKSVIKDIGKRCEHFNLMLNLSKQKISYFRTGTMLLGYSVSNNGIKPGNRSKRRSANSEAQKAYYSQKI